MSEINDILHHPSPGCGIHCIQFASGVFPVKHLCLYDNTTDPSALLKSMHSQIVTY